MFFAAQISVSPSDINVMRAISFEKKKINLLQTVRDSKILSFYIDV